jgi:glucuronoarabinoxylan endo-1,4-beta-xylanase
MFFREAASRVVAAIGYLILIAAALTPFNEVKAANITVNLTETHQTVDGFGAFASMPYLLRRAGDHFWVDRPGAYELDRFVKDLGASAARFEVPPDVYPMEGAPYNWSVDGNIRTMKELKARGCDRFILSVWSPPCWMKDGKQCFGPKEGSLAEGPLGNILIAPNYDKFAQFLADYCKMVKDSVGVEPYGLSCQNEPYFHEPYNSCVYGADGLNDIINRTKTKLQAASLNTRMFGAEHMFGDGTSMYGALTTNANVYAYAVHGYTNGINQDYGAATDWSNLLGKINGKKLWMTETTGDTSSTALIRVGKALHAAFLSGNVSLWTWWAYADNMGKYVKSTEGVNIGFKPSGTYAASKHWFRFVRPGAVRVGGSCDAATVFTTAWKNTDGSVAIVLVNTGTANTVTVSGATGAWNVYRSDNAGTKICEASGTSNGTGIAIAANELVTLFNGTAPQKLEDDTTADQVSAPPPSTTVGELNMHGDDLLDLYVNGSQISLGDDKKGNIALKKGENVIACKLQNTGWGGGLIGCMLLPGGDTLRTDATWKMSYVQPAEGWTGLTFNDATWYTPADFGLVNVWPGYERWGTSAVNFYYWKGHWITGELKAFMRKEFTTTGAFGLRFIGNNCSYKLYVNGTAVPGGTGQFSCTEPCQLNGTAITTPTINQTGKICIGVELEALKHDGNGVLFKMQIAHPGWAETYLDTTWKAWPEQVASWNTVGFNDQNWFYPGRVDAFCWSMAKHYFVYPNKFWFRKKFTSTEGVNVKVNVKSRKYSGISKVEYYNLMGQRMAIESLRRNANKSVMIEKKVVNGKSQVKKVTGMK